MISRRVSLDMGAEFAGICALGGGVAVGESEGWVGTGWVCAGWACEPWGDCGDGEASCAEQRVPNERQPRKRAERHARCITIPADLQRLYLRLGRSSAECAASTGCRRLSTRCPG